MACASCPRYVFGVEEYRKKYVGYILQGRIFNILTTFFISQFKFHDDFLSWICIKRQRINPIQKHFLYLSWSALKKPLWELISFLIIFAINKFWKDFFWYSTTLETQYFMLSVNPIVCHCLIVQSRIAVINGVNKIKLDYLLITLWTCQINKIISSVWLQFFCMNK